MSLICLMFNIYKIPNDFEAINPPIKTKIQNIPEKFIILSKFSKYSQVYFHYLF